MHRWLTVYMVAVLHCLASQGHCIHTPRGTHGRAGAAMTGRRSGAPSAAGAADAGTAGSATNQQSKAWADILAVFDELLVKLRDNHVPKPLVQALFKQLFSFVNVQLFNQLLLRRECCSFSNGEYVKTGLAQVGGFGWGLGRAVN